MLYKFSSILVVGMMVLGQPITVFANTIDSELQTNNSASEEHEEISDALEESSESTLDKIEENVIDSGSTVDSTSEESTPSSSTNNETDSSEESNNSDEVEKKEETLAEDVVVGTWGSVPWEWNSETATITLQGGNAGTVAAAPWKTYTNVQSIVVEGTVVLQANAANLFQNLKNLTYIDTLSFDTSQVTTFDFLFADSDSLEVLNLNGWNTSNVRSINRTFHNMTSLVELDISSWNMANVGNTSTNSWFIFEARNLRTIHLGVNTTFLHMSSSSRPVFQTSAPSVEYTGNWLYLKDQNGNDPEERVVTARRTLLSTFYDGSKPGTYILEKKVSQPVTVKFLDSEGNELAPSVTIEGEFGSQYSTEAKEIPGWSVVELPRNATGTFTDSPQEVVYVYDRSDAAPVTVRYVDTEGNPLSEPSILSGKVGLPYESEAKEIPGWYVTETPDNASGTFTEDPQEVVYVYDRSNAAPVTVKYQDSEGNQLSEPSILSGKVGLPYESEVKEIPGWYVPETPDNASGTFTEEPQEVVYVYDRSDAAPVTVKYQDSEGNQLAEPSILSGKVGLPYESEAKEIRGWYVAQTPDNASGTFTEDPQEVVYVYDRSDAAPITVRYVDTEGNQLSEPNILSGKVGLPYESEAKEIRGWYVPETPDNASGTFTEDPQEVVYVYDRSDAAPVTVKYQDTEGNQLAEPSILSGKVGLPYESEAKEIRGWYVPETPDNASGTFTEAPQEVVYVYDRSDAAPVTVRYVDTEGNQLSEPNILSGKVGLPYESEAKEIRGWYVPETPDNASGTFTEDPQEVVYVYDRSDAAPVTVRYVDTEGNQLSEPSILSGKVGLPYESEAKEIPGWYVVETPDNASGTFTEDPQEVVYVYDRSDAAPVTFRYVDTEGNQLSEPSILSGKVGLPYESEAKEIRGWYVTETPDNASGTFTEEPQEVVYVYDRSNAAPVTVKYQDSEGNQLSEPSILSGKVGLPYESEAKEIPGWYVAQTPDNASGTFTEEPQEVVYVYDRSDAAPVTVKYQDSEGNQLSEPSILSGKVGLPYESEAKEIRGWYVAQTPDNASGTFTEEPQEVVYVYDRSDAAPVTVKYQDSEGNQLSEPSILGGKVGLPYESEAKEIPGWYVAQTPDNASGTFTEEPQEVVYVYDRSDAAPVTVKYQDSEGNQLSEPSILSGKVGLPYESEAKEIPGWYVAQTPDNASGTFTEEPQEVVYVYDRSDAAPVTVKYQDTEGNQLAEPSILSGKVGLPYESEAKEIRGWYVTETPDNASGTFTEDPQEVVYVYDRSDAAPVTVRYVDTEGNQLSEPSILSGKVGLPYESEAREIPGWHVTAIPGNSSGIFTEEPQEVVYIYALNKIDSEQDNSDNDLPTDNNFSDSNKRLPNTGESLIGQLSMVLAGSLIVIGIFVFVVRKRKKEKD